MKTFGQRQGTAAALLAMVLAAAPGCDEDGGTCGPYDPVVIVEEECGPCYPYAVEVVVSDPAGYAVAGADVELIVAAVPEVRMYGYTDLYGRAWFEATAAPGVMLVAYVSAPGYLGDAGDVGTYAGVQVLHIPVVLELIY